MIIVSMGGGLGNQMFTYAFILKLKYLYPNQTFKVDMKYSVDNFDDHNGFELAKIFGIKLEQCLYREFRNLSDDVYRGLKNRPLVFFMKVFWKIKKICLGTKSTYKYQRDNTEYNSSFLSLSGKDYFFHGVFANSRYFEDIKEHVIKAYSFPVISDYQNAKWKYLIENTQSVSVHYRRGDYIKKGISVLDDSYYEKAANTIIEKVGCSCIFFIFSDDCNYAREHFSKCGYHFYVIDNNKGETSYLDMQLMSLCKHNIIANSSFSFWGAYLNQNEEKHIVYPKIPYNGCSSPFGTADWIAIEVN